MSHSKKRLAHHCTTHPKTLAVSRCSVCKAWICSQCGRKKEHQWYCNACSTKTLQPAARDAVPGGAVPQKPSPQKAPSLHSLVLLAGITLGLCGLVFGLWNMRIAADMTGQNNALREKRTELLGQIKQRNQELSALGMRLDSMRTMAETASPVKKTLPPPAAGLYRQALPVGGLPVSFDNGTSQKKLVAITFDGSDQANAAVDILDTLASRNVKATMFLSGHFLQSKPDLVRRILNDGHEVGNHTYSHPHLTSYVQDNTQTTLPSVSGAILARELLKTDSIFSALYGRPLSPLWRSPYGDHNRIICIWGQQAGFLHIGWGQGRTWLKNLDSNDWTPNEETAGYHTPQEVYDKIVELAMGPDSGINGGIILMHLGTVRSQREKQVHLVLGRLIDTLQSLGYRMVTVSELLRESDVDLSTLVKKDIN
jgi:peptidoglycan/xylan/chitin deacetylase (PgdA/CDA1 family)